MTNDISHFGIKGMRWGVRKQKQSSHEKSYQDLQVSFWNFRKKRNNTKLEDVRKVFEKFKKDILSEIENTNDADFKKVLYKRLKDEEEIMSALNNSEEISHFGIKGMKWGHRKQQKKEQEASEDFKKVANLMRKKPHELTNDELSTLTKRLNLEKEFKRLNPSQKDILKDQISGIFNSTVKPVLIGVAISQVKSVIEKALGKK